MIKEQEKHWQEATKKGLGDLVVADVDLEKAMMSGESKKQEEKDKDKGKAKEVEGYGKVYTRTHEKRAERSLSKAEKREQEEKRK